MMMDEQVVEKAMGTLLAEMGAIGGEEWKVFVVMLVGHGSHDLQDALLTSLQAAHPSAAIIGGVATGSHLVRCHACQLEAVEQASTPEHPLMTDDDDDDDDDDGRAGEHRLSTV